MSDWCIHIFHWYFFNNLFLIIYNDDIFCFI